MSEIKNLRNATRHGRSIETNPLFGVRKFEIIFLKIDNIHLYNKFIYLKLTNPNTKKVKLKFYFILNPIFIKHLKTGKGKNFLGILNVVIKINIFWDFVIFVVTQ